MYHMMLGPVVAFCIFVAMRLAMFILIKWPRQRFTSESIVTRVFTLGTYISYSSCI